MAAEIMPELEDSVSGTGDDAPASGPAQTALRADAADFYEESTFEEEVPLVRADSLNIEARKQERASSEAAGYLTDATPTLRGSRAPYAGSSWFLSSAARAESNDALQQNAIPYGVGKMELLSKHVSSKRLVYVSIYIIIFAQSLAHTTPKVVEPFLLSLFNGHSYVSAINTVAAVSVIQLGVNIKSSAYQVSLPVRATDHECCVQVAGS